MTLYEEALTIVDGSRAAAYGPFGECFEAIAKSWSAVLKRNITATEVCLCMIGLKLVRESYTHTRDNLRDAHGYLILAERLLAKAKAKAKGEEADGSKDE